VVFPQFSEATCFVFAQKHNLPLSLLNLNTKSTNIALSLLLNSFPAIEAIFQLFHVKQGSYINLLKEYRISRSKHKQRSRNEW